MTTEKYITLSIFLIGVPALTYLSIAIMPKRTQIWLQSRKKIPQCIIMALIVIACIWCLI